jgi:UDP-N-acetylmuramoyl-L-alanyl-D-glutamate--2,6-diaminopimelate ligase
MNFEKIKISCDSRTVEADDLFVVINCVNYLSNAKDAYLKGVRNFACDNETFDYIKYNFTDVKVTKVDNARKFFALECAKFYNSHIENVVAVTGTNGKSSVVNITYQLWNFLKKKSAVIGTLGLQTNFNTDLPDFPKLTTFDPLNFHKINHALCKLGVDHLAFEASSHGLDQYRCDGIKIKVAAFTNLTQDHLDYHKDMGNYFYAKLRLFTELLSKDGVAVLNINDSYSKKIAEKLQNKIIFYGLNNGDIYAKNLRTKQGLIDFDLVYKNKIYQDIKFNCVGNFQIENLLCAVASVVETGFSIEDIISHIPNIKSVKGRMDLAGKTKHDAYVYIDYAHTPDGLEKALQSLKEHFTEGNLWVVFGCGGNRDTEKRSIMGKIASDLADFVIVTDDNPRFEDPKIIRKKIIENCKNAIEINDRKDAINYAIRNLKPKDVLLIAGKGHEAFQIIGDKILKFDDFVEARNALENL